MARKITHPALIPYIPIVDFLGALLGADSEVVLHDIADLNHSIVAIANANISGRKVGGPATDLVLRIMQNPEYQKMPWLCNYHTLSRQGRAQKSSTFFIRDEKNNIAGLLCINIDNELLIQARDLLQTLTETQPLMENLNLSERFVASSDELSLEVIKDHLPQSPERMTYQEKLAVVARLNDTGLFRLKGAVPKAAEALACAESTIYRYLSQLKP
ncbi:hypothetical protein BTJ39_21230 [Izhakiella australiensis]|uniref:DNA-binding protein n=1 Tax=Izhakiella australiensis TaxID=1926881 RepID=A0A1S8YD04_9GAMM|nr:PAS domain-containing protein [Izhakiella australiensis]OON37001.1 hypothetical protein BTJ39_21230 [Izhakiella australiensis]